MVIRHHKKESFAYQTVETTNYKYLDMNILLSRTVRNKSLFSREGLVSDVSLQQWEWIKTNNGTATKQTTKKQNGI